MVRPEKWTLQTLASLLIKPIELRGTSHQLPVQDACSYSDLLVTEKGASGSCQREERTAGSSASLRSGRNDKKRTTAPRGVVAGPKRLTTYRRVCEFFYAV